MVSSSSPSQSPTRDREACSRNDDFDPNRYVESSGLRIALASGLKIVACFVVMAITTAIWTGVMLLLLPWPYERIKQGNLYGHITGRILLWILGNPIKITGAEHANAKAIYICNHASPLDIFLVMWLTPLGTVGIAKKEIIWYPLFGQLYVLANHLRIDRSNPNAAIRSINEVRINRFGDDSITIPRNLFSQVAKSVTKKDLSLIIFPEGTRSASGRLLPFKKGVVHIALQTKRPIVPIVITGTHRAWHKDSLKIRPAPLTVKFLPPIETQEWLPEKADSYLEMLRCLYVDNLPECQRPLN
ncbi:1-acyl-sn-glycerol-3-phosphate acyltransferase isoform X1 [Selaginella moellendorffii]|uniref:1-acyl-sn-glycerol-3-phosphate acyltransferase isoform X1 n=1 Tax=Selaginella moellendorffii TaxID=88036 RepID=UPI000D1CE0EF|nr:1-acyl-sn-glycerol-3-phosphate acyltransferase isoform X1 [Selaginella moellendorffii]|eukprot:XP_024528979.1 1-acyl-sn-glycerol-3-phosphate acyltransferase isoform X1 [Selaginella moellendorffii]